ncbi:LysR family transcriptional regulator [Zhengella mangrovi]|uniref:LysR family transcriptional regulator n=1 Tax=Zhengella mangrovi TaxID=1982044 RepID=A0A2G1QP09_9HYPH|nr:LysR family transcriptional regulator [Zhengella mangrovi]PHP67266.1 LysR family transcriptional regulator [Zhengella mangrovi]
MDTLTRMRAFIDVVDAEGFSAAARKIGRSKALLSKYVRELEDELGVLLLNRTTRQFSLTEAGHAYFKRASEIVRDIDGLQESMRESSGDVKGRIRLTAPRSFADAAIGQVLIDFVKDHPDIKLDIHLDDRFVDLVEEGFDLAIRISRLENSSLIARKISDFQVKLCATPAVIERHGRPETPHDMAKLPCISDTNGRWLTNWPFQTPAGDTITVPVSGPLEVNSPAVARAACLADLGFALIPDFVVDEDIRAGRLVSLLEDWVHKDSGMFAVYPHRRYLPVKVRVFVDYLAAWFKQKA